MRSVLVKRVSGADESWGRKKKSGEGGLGLGRKWEQGRGERGVCTRYSVERGPRRREVIGKKIMHICFCQGGRNAV